MSKINYQELLLKVHQLEGLLIETIGAPISPETEDRIRKIVAEMSVAVKPPMSPDSSPYYSLEDDAYEEMPVKTTGAQEPVAAAQPVNSARKFRFSLNDRFLYCRELFKGDNEEFNRTLEYISAMNDYGEAESYLIERLKLAPDEKDLHADFLTVIKSAY